MMRRFSCLPLQRSRGRHFRQRIEAHAGLHVRKCSGGEGGGDPCAKRVGCDDRMASESGADHRCDHVGLYRRI